MNSICALSQGTGEEMTVTCCLGNADVWPGILGMCSDHRGLFLQSLPLLPIPAMVLWTPRHDSQAQKRNLSLLFSNALRADFITTKLYLCIRMCPVQCEVSDANLSSAIP